MATTNEVARLIVEAETKGFAEALTRINQTEASLDALTNSYKSGAIGITDYIQHGQKLRSDLDALRAAYDAATAAVLKNGSTAAASASLADKTTAANRRSQMGMTNWAYAIQDATSVSGGFAQSLNSVTNNLQQVAIAAGVSGGTLIGMTVAVAGLQIIANNWDKIKAAITGTASEWSRSVEGMKKSLADLEKKKVKVGVDLLEIDTLKRQIKEVEQAIEAVNRLKGQKTKAEVASGGAVSEVLQETHDAAGRQLGGAEIEKALKAAIIPEVEEGSDVLTQARKKASDIAQQIAKVQATKAATGEDAIGVALRKRLDLQIDMYQKRLLAQQQVIVDIRSKIAEPEGDAAKELGRRLDQAQNKGGPAQRAGQAKLAELARKANLPALAGDIEGVGPDQIREDQKFDEGIDRLKDRIARRKEANAVQNALRNKQAEEGEREAAAETERIEEEQRVALDQIRARDGVKFEAARLADEARRLGKNDVDAYDHVWRGLYGFLAEELRRGGASGTGRVVTAAAQQLAGGAPQVAEQRQKARDDVARNARKIMQDDVEKEAGTRGLDKQAEAMLAAMRTQMHGQGFTTVGGRPQRLTPDQQSAAVERILRRQVAMASPELGAQRQANIAAAATAMGHRQMRAAVAARIHKNLAVPEAGGIAAAGEGLLGDAATQGLRRRAARVPQDRPRATPPAAPGVLIPEGGQGQTDRQKAAMDAIARQKALDAKRNGDAARARGGNQAALDVGAHAADVDAAVLAALGAVNRRLDALATNARAMARNQGGANIRLTDNQNSALNMGHA